MARRRQAEVRRPARSITAAATRLDPKDRERARRQARKRPLDWQRQAFVYYDDVGEVRFGANWMANALSRLRLVPAFSPEPGAQPVPVGSAEEAVDAGADEAERVAAQSVLARLGSSEGGESEILRGLGLNLFVPGEGYLIGRVDPETGDETWGVFSVSAVTVDGQGNYAIKPSPTAKRAEFITLDTDAFILLVGRRHPQYPDWPDSAMRGALDYCEDLRVLTAMIRAAASSRVPSKILGIPQEADFGTPDTTTDEGDGNESDDPLTRDLIAHMTTPLNDPKSAAALVPFILRLAGEDLDRTKVIDLTREIDRLAIELREETRRAFAASVDLPAEIITGRSDLNHWTMASVTQEAYTIHVEPYGQGIADALTFGYFRPSLVELVDDPRQWSIAIDPAGLVTSPDQSKDVQDAYDRGEVTGAYYRDVRGIPEDAAPDEEELQRRERLASIVGRSRGAAAPPSPVAIERAPEPSTGPNEDDAAIEEAVIVPEPRALTAAADDPLATLGLRLAQREMLLRERLRAFADEAMTRALERAGNRLRSLAQRNPLARQAVANVGVFDVAATLGPGLVASLGSGVDDLLDGAWSRIEQRWDVLVRRAQEDALRLVREAAGLTAAASDDLSAQFAVDRENGRHLLIEGLAHVAAERLYNPTIPVPEMGEFDAGSLVSPRLVRQALAEAGGGPLTDAAEANVTGGLLSGERMRSMLSEIAAAKFGNGYVWMHGAPERPFPPHEALDGVEFTSWTDDVLANDEGWPDVSHFRPDDHEGCTCEVARVVERSDEGAIESVLPTVRSRIARNQGARPIRLGAPQQVPSARSAEGWAAWGEQHGIKGAAQIWDALEASGVSETDATQVQAVLDGLMRRMPMRVTEVQASSTAIAEKGYPGAYGLTTPTANGTSIVRLSDDPKAWTRKAFDATTGWTTGPTDATATLVHEVGHATHVGLSPYGVDRLAFLSTSQRIAQEVGGGNTHAFTRFLGGNSTKNGNELFADAFKMRHHPKATLPPEGQALLDEYARRMNEWVATRTRGEVTEII